jgi:2-polyprenyl-3-methyl-5-hydroxy-6-metoxy-1,4-benzoquinol methylase
MEDKEDESWGDNFEYVGNELELFATTINWKRYYRDLINQYITGRTVVEIGAGLGEMTKTLTKNCDFLEWTCVEPDLSMGNLIRKKIDENILPKYCSVRQGLVFDLQRDKTYDTIIYIDSLEHIENDQLEVEKATNYLNPAGHFIIIVPAHNWLFSPWDRTLGHYRRYNKHMICDLRLEGLSEVCSRYFDSVGLIASLCNKVLLKQSMPTHMQIRFWDSVLVRISRVIDRIIFYSFGKNLLVVWKKT